MEILGIGDRLRTLRNQKGLSLKQASSRLGITASTLSGYELEDRHPSYKNLLRLARLYSVSCDYILGNTGRQMVDATGLTEKEVASVTGIISLLKEARAGK